MRRITRLSSVTTAIVVGALMVPSFASANTSGDVTFDLDPTNVPTCASSITAPVGTVDASIVDTNYWETESLYLPDQSNTSNDQIVWEAIFMSSEFDLSWQVNNCWGPSYGGWLAEPDSDTYLVVTKTRNSDSVTSSLPFLPQGSGGVANSNQVWISDGFSSVKLGSQNQWTELADLSPMNGTSPSAENVYRMRLELGLKSNYETFLQDSTYTATATYELWEGGY